MTGKVLQAYRRRTLAGPLILVSMPSMTGKVLQDEFDVLVDAT